MIKETNIFIIKIIIFLNFISFYFSQDITNENIIQNYYLISSEQNNINIIVDKFYFGNINNNNSFINYSLVLLNDTEQIFFDFQSEFGCLYINANEEIKNNSNKEFRFCSEGSSKIFIINKKDLYEKIDLEKKDSFENSTINISISYSPLEYEKELNFYYSLKVSLRKPEINIFEINSNHKTLCKTENTKDGKYRCLFLITNNNNENNDNLIVYSVSQNNSNKLNIFADYINKDEYDNWNTEYLINNIPNINSNYNNYNSEMNFVYIQNNNLKQYIFVSIESNNEENIEIISQSINNEFELPKINNIKIYEINKTSENLNFNHLLMNDISFSLVTLYGKAKIQFQYDNSTQYITDIRENKLLFRIHLESCKKNNNCNLIINNLEENDKIGLGYIFYISYSEQSNNLLNELIDGKSSKFLQDNNFKYPIIFYDKIPNNSTPININLQLYNSLQIESFNESIFDIEVLIISKEDIYNFKLNYSYIQKYNHTIKGKFDSVLSASNIYLSSEEINSFEVLYDKYLLIYITTNININVEKLIIGSTISQINNLIYPSERIYHYGKLNNEEKIVYKLKGNENYHLMRLEFGCNNNNIKWSVKRNNDNYNYKENDTDLSFVTEKWANGRELLTMYIERGEDIYLTIFYKNIIRNNNLTNYIFKYINSAKNGDFKNFIVYDDSLSYDIDIERLEVNKLKNIPTFNKIQYYLRVIKENDYINNEGINTIALTESKNNLALIGKDSDNKIYFYLKKFIDKKETYYINVYSIIVENNSDIEYFSYSSFKIEGEINKQPNIILIIISLAFVSFIIIMIIIRLIQYCIKERKKRYIRLRRNLRYNNNYRYYDNLLY